MFVDRKSKVESCENYIKHLVNLTLAENCPTNKILNIDILIVGVFYWKFFNGNVINTNEDPVTMGTCLVWV